MQTTLKSYFGGFRILLSTVCVALIVVLALLWGRSCFWIDHVIGPQSGSLRPQMSSSDGWLTLRYRNDTLSPNQFTGWRRQTTTIEDMETIYRQIEESIKNKPGATFTRPAAPTFQFGWKGSGVFCVPYWLPIIALAGSGFALGWKQDWRFSLKTILLWITLSAVFLTLSVQYFQIFQI